MERATSFAPPIGGSWRFAAQESMVSTLVDPRELHAETKLEPEACMELREDDPAAPRLGPRQR